MLAGYVTAPEQLVMSDLPIPEIGAGEALIRVLYAGVCGSDLVVYRGAHPTGKLPVVLGHEFIGIVEKINAQSPFQVGDRVTAEPLISCGVCEACLGGHFHVCQGLRLLGIHENGGYAQYVRVNASKLVAIPDNLSDEVGALAEPFAVGYHVCQRSGMRAGDDVLVIGGGPIGTVVALTAREFGAKVVVSEPNEKRRAVAQRLKLHALSPDALKDCVQHETDGNGFDVVIESSGSKMGILSTTQLCKIRGTIVPMSLAGTSVDFTLGQVSFKEQSVVGSRVYPFLHFGRGVELLGRLADKMNLSPVISDIMPLSQAQEAIDAMIAGTNACKILLKP